MPNLLFYLPLFIFILSSSVHAQDITTGLVGHWKFDEGSGIDAADSSGSGNDGTLSGPAWVSGRIGSALHFDGSDDTVEGPDDATISGLSAVSFGAWINPDEWAAGGSAACQTGHCNKFIVAKSNWASQREYRLRYDTTSDPDAVLCHLSTDGTNTQDDLFIPVSAIPTGSWSHIMCTWDANTDVAKLYLNGVLYDSAAFVGTNLFDGSADFSMGESADNGYGGGRENFDGLIDDARIYNRALTDADVAALAAGECSNPSGAAGKIVYNATANVMQYCNGTRWKAMGPFPGAGGAGCSNPTRVIGSLLYNATANVMQYCDGTNWKAMGPVPGAGGAGCSNPAGATGSMVFNVDAAVIQYCDGTNWKQMGS